METTAQVVLKKILEWMNDPHNKDRRNEALFCAHNFNCKLQAEAVMAKFEKIDRERHDLKEQSNVKYEDSK